MKQTVQNVGQIKLAKMLRKKDALERISIEGKFGLGKNGYRLNYIRARTAATSEAWIRAIFLVMNLMVLLRCWCSFCFEAMKTRIFQLRDDQLAFIRFGLDKSWAACFYRSGIVQICRSDLPEIYQERGTNDNHHSKSTSSRSTKVSSIFLLGR